MPVEEQFRTIAFLRKEMDRDGDGTAIEVIETHISVVVLGEDRVFKLKRAVRLPYADFSTPERRLDLCRREVELNRVTAPTLYRGVCRITREDDGRLAFDGEGKLVDAVVDMARFDGNTLFDALAERGEFIPAILTSLARTIAGFHDRVPVIRGRSGSDRIAAVLELNAQELRARRVFTPTDVASLVAGFESMLARHAERLDRRERDGKVRRCHGDLHLSNLCLVDGRPTLFDCIEFDEELATVDVLYDLAFLLMDLWHRSARSSANLVFNRYLDARDEGDGISLFPFFMAVRAAVRAHVTARQAEEADRERGDRLAREARSYFDLAAALLAPVPARLVAIGGFSGSGKSTAAAAIAHRHGPAPGARILSSDRTRKELHGVDAETPLPADAYRSEISERVYAVMAERAAEVLRTGHAVIADAVFDRSADRARIERVAAEAGVAFAGFWLDAPPDALVGRVIARRGDPSDATEQVVRDQMRRDTGPMAWSVISTADGSEMTAKQLAARLKSAAIRG